MAEATKTAGGAGGDPLGAFLEAAQGFVEDVSAAMAAAAGDDPDAPLIEGTARTIVAQFRRATEEVRGAYKGANLAARRRADQFIALQEGTMLAQNGTEIARRVLERGAGRGFFTWVTANLREIKKIIGMIIGLFSKRLKEMWETISVVIDELWDLIASLLGGVFGFNRKEIAAEASAGEVNFLNELAALARLQAASRSNGDDDEE